MKTHVVKKPVLPEDVGHFAYFPVYPFDVDVCKKNKDGEILLVNIRKDILHKLRKKYWAICDLVAQNKKSDPEWDFLDNKYKVDVHLKMATGRIKDILRYPDGTLCPITESISDNGMSGEKFQEFYNEAIEHLVTISGISRIDLELNWMEYETEVGE